MLHSPKPLVALLSGLLLLLPVRNLLKHKTFPILLLLSGLCLPIISVWAGDYHVATTGSDKNDGKSSLKAFKTIGTATAVMTAGDTCYIHAGRYQEQIVSAKLRGTKLKPIVFTAFKNDKVIIDGTVSIASIQTKPWKLHAKGIYKTKLSEDIWQLFLNGEMMIAGRWPNASFADNSIWDRKAWAHGSTESAYQLMATRTGDGRPDLAATGLSFDGAMAVLNIQKWTTFCQPVTSHTAGSGSFKYGPEPAIKHASLWNNGYWEETQRYYLEAHLNCVDVESEWYFDKDTKELYFMTPGGSVPSGDIRGKIRTYGFDLNNISYVRIQGIDFFGCSLQFKNAGNCVVEDCRFEYFAQPKRMLGETSGKEAFFKGGINIAGSRAVGAPSGNTIRNCVLAYCDGQALSIVGRNDLVENVLAHDLDWSGTGSSDFFFRWTDGLTFRRVTAYNSGASECVDMGFESVAELCNMGTRMGALQDDGGAIQFRPEQMSKSVARYNWSHDHTKFGIRGDIDGSALNDPNANGSKWTVHHNVIWGIKVATSQKPGIMVEGDSNYVYNNTSFDNEPRDICLPVQNGWANKKTITRNNFTDTDGIGSSRTGGDDAPGIADHNKELSAVEQMVNPAHLDFRPKAGSPLIDAGTKIPGITDGFRGKAPDAGAYEYGSTSYWIPGYQTPKASTPIPADGATDQLANRDLIWLSGWQGTSFNVYFGTNSKRVKFASKVSPEFKRTQTNNIYMPTRPIRNKTYYWRIDTVTPKGTVKGDVWKLTYGSN